MRGVLLAAIRVGPAVRPAIVVGHHCFVHVGWRALPAGAIELVRAHIHESVGVSMVSPLEHDDVLATGVRLRHAERQLVGLASRADEVADAEGFWEQLAQPCGVVHRVLVQVAGVGVEQGDLPPRGPDDSGMAVTDVAHVVHAVQVRPAGFVVQELPPSPDDVDRRCVGQAQVRSEPSVPGLHQLRPVHGVVGPDAAGESED